MLAGCIQADLTAESYCCLRAEQSFVIEMDRVGLDRRRGGGRGGGGGETFTSGVVYIQPCCANVPNGHLPELRRWGDSRARREREMYCRLNSVSLQLLWLCQHGFDLSLEEPGCSESLGFYNEMHHYPGIVPSSEYGRPISYYCLGEAEELWLSALRLCTITSSFCFTFRSI